MPPCIALSDARTCRAADVKIGRSNSSSAAIAQFEPGCQKSSVRGAVIDVQGECRTIHVSDSLPDGMHRLTWSLRDFELTRQLYRGKLSIVFAALDKMSGKQVVLKMYRKRKLTPLNCYQVEREIAIHSKLEHENIVKFYASFEDDKLVYLVQELVAGGDLFDALGRSRGPLKERDAVQGVMIPLMQALSYLHSAGVIHRDIKPENILLETSSISAKGVKLADFGMAVNSVHERPVSRVGTLDYMAPEILICPDKAAPLDNKENPLIGYTAQVDAWALGILAFEVLVGYPPFEHESRTETYDCIMYKDPQLPASMSEEAKSFIKMALCKNASKRPSVKELFHHPWIVRNAAPDQLTDRLPSPASKPLLSSWVPTISPFPKPPAPATAAAAPNNSISDPECPSQDQTRKGKPQDAHRAKAALGRSPAAVKPPPPLQTAAAVSPAAPKAVLAQSGIKSPTSPTGGIVSARSSPAPAERHRTLALAHGAHQPWPFSDRDCCSPDHGLRCTEQDSPRSALPSAAPSPSAADPAEPVQHRPPAPVGQTKTTQPWYVTCNARSSNSSGIDASQSVVHAPALTSAARASEAAILARGSDHGAAERKSCPEAAPALLEARAGRGAPGQLRVEIPTFDTQLGHVGAPAPEHLISPKCPQPTHDAHCRSPVSTKGSFRSPFSAQSAGHDAPQQPQERPPDLPPQQPGGSSPVRSSRACAGVLCEEPRMRSFSMPGAAPPGSAKTLPPAEASAEPAACPIRRSASSLRQVQPNPLELNPPCSDSGPSRSASMPGNVGPPGGAVGASAVCGVGGSPLSRSSCFASPGSGLRASSRFAEATGLHTSRVAGPPRQPARCFPSASLSSPNFRRLAGRLDSGSCDSGSSGVMHRALSLEELEGRDSLSLDFNSSVYIPKDQQEAKPCRYGAGANARDAGRRPAAAPPGEAAGYLGCLGRQYSDGLLLQMVADIESSGRSFPGPKQPGENKIAQGAVVSKVHGYIAAHAMGRG